MDGRGGCCIASYGANGVYDMSKMDMIMLRFRPIAPKPAAGAGSSAGSSPEKADAYVKSGGRGKRRYVKSNNSNNSSNSSGSSSSGNSGSNKRCNSNKKRKASPEVVTLPLLPETPDRKVSPARLSTPAEKKEVAAAARANLPALLSFDGKKKNNSSDHQVGFWSSDRTVVMGVGSCVIVECVTDTWTVDGQLGSTDEERRMSLERDTCPGFVSDGLGKVTWTNGAYRKMMMMDHHHDHHEVAVWLVVKEESLREIMARTQSYTSFTCRVRLVQYDTCGKERSSITLPCDVWRLDSGGFAWRLDVKAALSLGR
ncbi:hypothetical protein CMV_000180 [Castanea mollissima]|uniref:DUF7950 domain-containing protein n=1 Tax=Castanea mollissima TaxID=60419 RepID=A0A8J4RX76_9ROSI|nr:hypothetical protein CMV_000180 [Castanea mollissima]